MAVQFGVITPIRATSTGAAWALVQELTGETSVSIAVSRDAAGDVDAYQTSGKEQTVRLSVIYDSGVTDAVSAGDTIRVGTAKSAYLIESVSHAEKGKDYTRVEITAKRWPGNGVPNNS